MTTATTAHQAAQAKREAEAERVAALAIEPNGGPVHWSRHELHMRIKSALLSFEAERRGRLVEGLRPFANAAVTIDEVDPDRQSSIMLWSRIENPIGITVGHCRTARRLVEEEGV